MELLGAHVSTAGGVETAPARAQSIGATALQLFTKTPNQWREPVVTPAQAEAFQAEMQRTGIRMAVSHDSYLINLASPDDVILNRSLSSFTGELRRCTILGIPYIVSHPGNYMDDRDAGLRRNAANYARCLDEVPGNVIVLLETTAGTGTALGRTFEELAELRALMPEAHRARIGICADTCHLYSAGYDLVNEFDEVWQSFDRHLGMASLKCLHLNDSKTPYASHKDRHEVIGEGSLGESPFRRIMTDPRFSGVIKLIETPKGDDEVTQDRLTLERLRAYAAAGDVPTR